VARIMVVDDSGMTRKMLSLSLSREGFAVEMAENGMEALEKLFKDRYDLVITDMNMPQMDGMELLRHLRNDSQYRSVPVVVLSSNSTPEEIQRAMKAGANFYLIKPTDSAKLIECVRKALRIA
jgi:two-component system chemotaxis response regulator CheY